MELVKVLHSPFKFLDAYQKEDITYFFGRQADVDQLYQLVCGASCLLVYGYSGVGKTSLIRCGLVNRFHLSNWLDIHIRRGRDINSSLQQAISEQLIDEVGPGPEKSHLELLHQLYLDYFKPIYLVFDQFEELFLLGSQQEQTLFTEIVKAILTDKTLKCKVILVMREEYIARLDDMEEKLPLLRHMRVRIKPLTNEVIKNEVIPLTCKHYQIQLAPETAPALDIASELVSTHPVAEAIVQRVKGKSRDVSLPYLQLYLDRLWLEASKIGVKYDQGPLQFTEELVSQTGDIGQVLGAFLDTQLAVGTNQLNQRYSGVIPDDTLRKVVNEFITPKGTKRQRESAKILIEGIATALIQDSILWLVDARILRQVHDQEGHLDNTIYELAHDALAKHIYEHRSENDKRYYYQRNYIDRVYKLYNSEDNSTIRYLTKDELASIQEFRSRLKAELPEAVWQYVEESEETLETEQQRKLKNDLQTEQEARRKETRYKQIAIVFAVIAITFLLLGSYWYSSLQTNKTDLLKEKSSRLVQLLDDYETKLTSAVPGVTPGVLYDNPTFIRQIATEAAQKIETDTNERAKEWIQRLNRSKNDNVFYQLSIDSHLPNPVAGFTEDGKMFVAAKPGQYMSAVSPTESTGFMVWTIDTTGTSWLGTSVVGKPYTLVGVDCGLAEPVVQLLTVAQVNVLTQLAILQNKPGPHKRYRLKPFANFGQTGPLTALYINGYTKHALLGFTNGHVYRWQTGLKQPDLLPLPTGKFVKRVLFSPGGRAIVRVRKNEEDKSSAGPIQLAPAFLIERYDQASGELITIKELPYQELGGMSISPEPKHLHYLLGPSPSDSPDAVSYYQPDTSRAITLLGHRVPVRGTAFSPNGRMLLTADTMGIVRIYSTRRDREHLPIAPLLPVEKMMLGMALTDDELTEGLFKTSDWSRLTQTLFIAEEYLHRNSKRKTDFNNILAQIGDTTLVRRQSPDAVYWFWLRLLPNLEQQTNKDVKTGYQSLSNTLKNYLQQLPESQVTDLIKLSGTTRYDQQARKNIYIWSKWVDRYPSLISDTLLNRVSQIIQTDIKQLTEQDTANIRLIMDAACREVKSSSQQTLFYPQLHELIYQFREKGGDQNQYQAYNAVLAKRLRMLPSTDFNRIAGLGQLLATNDRSPYWWTILANEYKRRRITQDDYQILIQGSLAFYQVLDGNYSAAVEAACQGLRVRPVDKNTPVDWIQSNLAIALLMVGRTDEAKAIYEAYKNQPYRSYRFRDAKILFRQAFLDDIDELKKRQKGYLSPQQLNWLEEVRKMVLEPTSQATIPINPTPCQPSASLQAQKRSTKTTNLRLTTIHYPATSSAGNFRRREGAGGLPN